MQIPATSSETQIVISTDNPTIESKTEESVEIDAAKLKKENRKKL